MFLTICSQVTNFYFVFSLIQPRESFTLMAWSCEKTLASIRANLRTLLLHKHDSYSLLQPVITHVHLQLGSAAKFREPLFSLKMSFFVLKVLVIKSVNYILEVPRNTQPHFWSVHTYMLTKNLKDNKIICYERRPNTLKYISLPVKLHSKAGVMTTQNILVLPRVFKFTVCKDQKRRKAFNLTPCIQSCMAFMILSTPC